MLPSAKASFIKGGLTSTAAAWAVLGGFVCGFIAIQIVSRYIHSHIPSTEKECEPTPHDFHHSHNGSRRSSSTSYEAAGANSRDLKVCRESGRVTESTPLLSEELNGRVLSPAVNNLMGMDSTSGANGHVDGTVRRPSMIQLGKTRALSFLKDTKGNCDSKGPCYGFSKACGHHCVSHSLLSTPRRATMPHTAIGSQPGDIHHDDDMEASNGRLRAATTAAGSRGQSLERQSTDEALDALSESPVADVEAQTSQHTSTKGHHHEFDNMFMSSGVQSVISIAVHKFPEGFITFATNHANPALGWSVFIALSIHSIVEGFIMAMPLHFAFGSKGKAFWTASIIGGLSQPAGAGIAAAWFKIAGKNGGTPSEALYGGMFAVTSGIMASVAIQLFTDSLDHANNKTLCTGFAFLGIIIMGAAQALTA
jgi:ZIP family zinc transporter